MKQMMFRERIPSMRILSNSSAILEPPYSARHPVPEDAKEEGQVSKLVNAIRRAAVSVRPMDDTTRRYCEILANATDADVIETVVMDGERIMGLSNRLGEPVGELLECLRGKQ